MESRVASIVLACISLVSLILMIVAGVLDTGVASGVPCSILGKCLARDMLPCDGLKNLLLGVEIACIVCITLLSYCLIMHALQAAGLHFVPDFLKTIARYLHSLVLFVAMTMSTMLILFVTVPWGTKCGLEKPMRSQEGLDFGIGAWLCLVVFVLEIAGCIVSGSEVNAPKQTYSNDDYQRADTEQPMMQMQPIQPPQHSPPAYQGAPQTTRL